MIWILFIVVLVGAALFIAADIALHRAAPMIHARIINTLSTRFNSRVELDSFDVSVLRGFEVSGGGLKIYPNDLDMDVPLFSVDRFSFHTGWASLFRSPMHIGLVTVSGLGINMPPKDQRKGMPKLQKPGEEAKKQKIEVMVDELQIDNATLILKTDKPGKIPLEFDIASLRMTSVGAGQPMHFHAILTNPKPIGNIDSTGSFGPYLTASPGDTPISGTYNFSHADLNSIKGIGGMLSSTGKYEGTLNNITVDGETDTPNFSIDTANHPVPLHTKFHAIVDGTNGDTYLQPVDAMLGHSHIVAKGDVVRAEGGQGHDIRLDVTVDHAHIDDMLRLAVKTDEPLMTGALTLHTKLFLPPGKMRVADKLQLKGRFEIADAHFTSPKIQAKIDQLSLRGQGKAKEAQQESKGGQAANAVSAMQGDFALGNSKLEISNLVYTVPGANISMDGVYSLDGKQLDFHGKARLDAHVSQMVTGWKSMLLKPVDRFFAKAGAGTQVPISVTGTQKDPHIGLDFGRKEAKPGEKPTVEMPPPAQPRQPQ